jgi:hypothetical protein
MNTATSPLSNRAHRSQNIISCDSHWQFPAITEQHAFHKIRSFLRGYRGPYVYFAFPWATLIDYRAKGQKESAHALLQLAKSALKLRRPGERLVTVCQHVHLTRHRDLVDSFGIDHFFWSHTSTNSGVPLGEGSAVLHPFPLYAVNHQPAHPERPRDLLFSFVGATSNQWYLTNSRALIASLLAHDPRGHVSLRQEWHYQKIVYDQQIFRTATAAQSDSSYAERTAEFCDLLSRSIFTLCPGGSGPNSIRLWEAIGAGSIPVILSDNYLPPGPRELWLEAATFCSETVHDIKALPVRLRRLEQNPELLERKTTALKQLWLKYGHDCFVYDVLRLFFDGSQLVTFGDRPATLRLSDKASSGLVAISRAILNGETDLVRASNTLWRGLYTRATLYPDDLQTAAKEHPEIPAAARISKRLLSEQNERLSSRRVCAALPELS